MKLVHYSHASVSSAYSVPQRPEADSKPKGFWLSCDGFRPNWLEWCIGENFGLRCLTHAHDVKLVRKANILRLRTPKDIDDFTEQHRDKIKERWSYRMIRWAPVAARYQGIIIAPYIWQRRLHDEASWYYSWDCASGCIWDASAIRSITLREQPLAEAA